MGLDFHKTTYNNEYENDIYKGVQAHSESLSATKGVKRLTAKNLLFLKKIGLTPTNNNGYPQS